MISAVLSVAASALSLMLASRVMNVALALVPVLLVAAFSYGVGLLMEGMSQPLRIAVIIGGLWITLIGLKRFTGESNWTVIKLMIVWFIVSIFVATAFWQLLS